MRLFWGEALRSARVSASGWAISAISWWTARPQVALRFSSRAETARRREDRSVAEKLIPKNHGFGTRRVPLEAAISKVTTSPTSHWSTSTRRRSSASPRPASRPATPSTSSTSSSTRPVSTRSTGAFHGDRLPRGRRGVAQGEVAGRPPDLLGILVDGFPDMLMVIGPHAGLGNFPRVPPQIRGADWVTRLIRFARDRGLTRISPLRRVPMPGPTTSLRRARACCSPRSTRG